MIYLTLSEIMVGGLVMLQCVLLQYVLLWHLVSECECWVLLHWVLQ